MTAKPKKTTAERIAAARAEQAAFPGQIKAMEEQRRRALLIGDDRAAERADIQLGKLRLVQQRVADKIDLLTALAAVESKAWMGWPQDLKAGEVWLNQAEEQQRELASRPRSQADFADAVSLRHTLTRMSEHVALLRRVEVGG